MSPRNWDGSWANVVLVNGNGHLTNNSVNNTWGLRPILFYNSYTKLRQSIVELEYKINR